MIELGLKGNWYLISWFAYLIKFVWTTCTLSETSGSLVCLPFCMQGYSMGALSVVGAGLLHRTITMNILLWQMSLPWVTSRENETELRPQIRTVFFFFILFGLCFVSVMTVWAINIPSLYELCRKMGTPVPGAHGIGKVIFCKRKILVELQLQILYLFHKVSSF